MLLVAIPLAAQEEFIDIQWHDSPSGLRFPGVLYENGEATLPYFGKKYAWTHAGMVPRAEIEVTRTAPWEGPEPEGLKVGGEPEYTASLVREAGRMKVLVRVLPFVRDEAGTLKRVEQFSLSLKRETALAPLKSLRKGEWTGQSALASGKWYKIAVEESGIHRLSFEQLLDLGLQDPASARIYGNGARLLPEDFSKGYTDDLSAVPVHLEKGSDGLFGPGDHLYFYAEGPVAWQWNGEERLFEHILHPYSYRGFYFVTDGNGLPPDPETAALSQSPPTHVVRSYDYRTQLEEETYNLISSGREWYGDLFSVSLEQSYEFALPGVLTGDTTTVKVATAGRSGTTSRFRVTGDDRFLGTLEMRGTDLGRYTATYAYTSERVFRFLPGDESLSLELSYDRPDANSEGWLDYITVNARSRLSMEGSDQVDFRDHRSLGTGNVAQFEVEGGNGAVIWDITDPGEPKRVPYTASGSDAHFTVAADQLREYIAFRPGGTFPSPVLTGAELGEVPNQDLHGLDPPDMVIITAALFREEAERLAAHRRQKDGLEVEVVLQEQVFNEFSSGTPDVTAIRNFMKMFYDRAGAGSERCRYLLLFGDGSYDNRSHPEKKNNPNLILTYQSGNSLSPIQSFVSDDFYGLLDNGESLYNGMLDIGIGRLPASTPDEAENLVDKIIAYGESRTKGDWRNQICFIGDDADGNLHMRQADELAGYVKESYPAYNIQKIYLDAYPRVKSATGFRYPDVQRAINNQVNRGALIVNYTGHGGPAGLAHEQVVTTNDILSWGNTEMLPLFMTATCEFSRYDEYDHTLDQEITSAGEEVLLNTSGGGIGLFTTTRLVYSGPNHFLNERFYEVVFEKDSTGGYYRLGDIIAYSKNNTGAGVNKRNFTLLGDPSMRLAYPEHRVVTDSLNGVAVEEFSDTLSAFNWVTVSGHVESQDGSLMEDFDGLVYPMVFDKLTNVETLANPDNATPFTFQARMNILYSGKATVSGGRFTFGFYIPKDINYAFGTGKISYYANNDRLDAHGSYAEFHVGGIGSDNALDQVPPEVELFMNDTRFRDGGITTADPTLLVHVRDNFGINTTGNGIGHDLTAVLDGNRVGAAVLNEFYQANTDSYNSGTIRYPYSGLELGEHEITVKIWDIHNNSTEETIRFLVADSEEMLLDRLFAYPNPFSNLTRFNIEHNRPDSELRLVLTIHSLSGQVVRVLDRRVFSAGYRLEPVAWDGTSEGGKPLPGGVYLYRATLSTLEGEVASSSGKVILTR